MVEYFSSFITRLRSCQQDKLMPEELRTFYSVAQSPNINPVVEMKFDQTTGTTWRRKILKDIEDIEDINYMIMITKLKEYQPQSCAVVFPSQLFRIFPIFIRGGGGGAPVLKNQTK